MVCLLREKNQLEQVQICSQLEIILTFSRKCLFYRIFTLPNFTLHLGIYLREYCKYTFTQVVQRAVIDIQVQNIIRRSWSYKVALIYCNNMSGLACCIGKNNQFLSFLYKVTKICLLSTLYKFDTWPRQSQGDQVFLGADSEFETSR